MRSALLILCILLATACDVARSHHDDDLAGVWRGEYTDSLIASPAIIEATIRQDADGLAGEGTIAPAWQEDAPARTLDITVWGDSVEIGFAALLNGRYRDTFRGVVRGDEMRGDIVVSTIPRARGVVLRRVAR